MKIILLDRKLILGIGIGFLICSLLLIAFPQPKLSKEGVEEMARSMGMIYRDEVKAMFDSSK